MTIEETIKKSIKKHLEAESKSQRKFALEIGMLPQNLNQVMQGLRHIPKSKIAIICKKLGLEINVKSVK